MKAHTRKTQNEVTPQMALDFLKEGNERRRTMLMCNIFYVS
jgi:hypothetical protein